MKSDDLKLAWQSQGRQLDADSLLKEMQRNDQQFTRLIFARDAREIGVALVLLPLWVFLGTYLSLPWTWYLAIPAMLWIIGFMLFQRRRNRRQPSEPESLRARVQTMLQEVDHQIWLLRNVFWWYLLPPSIAIFAFFVQIAWEKGANPLLPILVVTALYGFLYWLNQLAVRVQLIPRRQELEALLASLAEETPAPESIGH